MKIFKILKLEGTFETSHSLILGMTTLRPEEWKDLESNPGSQSAALCSSKTTKWNSMALGRQHHDIGFSFMALPAIGPNRKKAFVERPQEALMAVDTFPAWCLFLGSWLPLHPAGLGAQ